MKKCRINLKIHVQTIIVLFSSTISTNTLSLQRVSSLQTPEQRRNMIARQAAFKKMQEQKEMTELLSAMVPSDVLKHHLIPDIIKPVSNYLKAEIAKKNILNPMTLEGHPSKITNAQFSKNGKILVTSCEGDQNNLIIWDVEKAKKLHTISAPNAPGTNVALVTPSPDGSKVVSVAGTQKKDENNIEETTNPKIIIWDRASGKQIKELTLTEGAMGDIEWSFDSKRIVFSIHKDKKADINIADGTTGNIIATHHIEEIPIFELNPAGNTMLINAKEELTLYDLTTGKMLKKLEGLVGNLFDYSYSADGKKIVATNPDSQTVLICDGQTGNQLKQFNNLTADKASLNSNGTKMLTTDFNNNTIISIWDVATQTIISTISAPVQVYFVHFSPDSTMIAATMENSDIVLWNATSGEQLFTASGEEVIFSSDSKRIQTHTSSSAENREKRIVTLWDTTTKYLIKTFTAHQDLFATTPDFYNIVTPDDNNNHNFILWTPFTPEERSALTKMNELTIKQTHYLHQLYTTKLRRLPVSTANSEEFKGLPAEIQSMITRYLSTSQISMQPTIKMPQAARPLTPQAPGATYPPVEPPLGSWERPITPPVPTPRVKKEEPKSWWEWATTGW